MKEFLYRIMDEVHEDMFGLERGSLKSGEYEVALIRKNSTLAVATTSLNTSVVINNCVTTN